MTNIDKTVKSKYPPKQKNVNWIDTSGDKPEMKTFFNGKWSSVGGSGADSTNPTEADATKVWQVTPVLKETKTETHWIIPEQTAFNMDDLTNVDVSYLMANTTVIVNFDREEYNCEVIEDDGNFEVPNANPRFDFQYNSNDLDTYIHFTANKGDQSEHTISMRYEEEVPIYDYNWASGVKIPIPTAEDEGKILVVTETEGNTFTIVPEQPVPIKININEETPLTGVDLTKFVVGNTVKVTITPEENDDNDDTPAPIHIPDYSGPVSELEQGGSSGTTLPAIPKSTTSQTVTLTGVIEEHEGVVGVLFNINDTTFAVWQITFAVWQINNLLYTSASDAFGPNVTIKLEYIESNYEYQLQENSGSSGSITVDPNNPPTELEPNTIYNYGTLNDDTTFPQLKDSETDGNVYCWFFWTSSPVPEITVPENLIWANGTEPVWSANKYYEITVMNNIATCLEV